MLVEPSITKPITGTDRKLDPAAVYEQYADFVWRSLGRCGLSSADQKDAFQEVFVVVHTKLDSFQGNSAITTWLFGICLRVAKKQRRFAFFRNFVTERPPEIPDARTPERELERSRASQELRNVLDRLPPEQRAVFTMFEIEEMDCGTIAALMGVPVGTVYSRLHAARARFRREYERYERAPRGGGR